MEGWDFQVYNKCLFRSIDFNELKSELKSRNVNFAPSDTYYIRTLRLRKDILLHSDPQNVILENIRKDLDEHEKTKFRGGSRYFVNFQAVHLKQPITRSIWPISKQFTETQISSICVNININVFESFPVLLCLKLT